MHVIDAMRRAVLRSAPTAAAVIALCGAVRAQDAATTGAVRGQTLTQEGAPLSDVTVTATNAQTGFARQAHSGADGYFTIPLLPPGTYVVQAQRIGYQATRTTDVLVRLGASTTANFRLRAVTVVLEPLVVRTEPEVNVTSGGVSEAVNTEQIENLPSLGRDFTDAIRLSGLVAPNPETTTGGKFSIAGQRPSQTSVQIDGVDANSGFFGENRGGSRIPFSFSLESIREFQVITNGFDVEYGNYSGGIVNVVTRGGTNTWEGTAYVNYRNDAFTKKDFNGVDAADYKVTQFAGRISGPIVRDRAFFLFSIDGQIRREPQLPLTVAGATDAATADSIERFIGVLGSDYGVSDPAAGYQPFQTTNDVLTLFGRIDWTINPAHRLSVRHNFSTYDNGDEFNENFDFIYGRSRAELLQDDAHSFVTELQSAFGGQTYNVLRFQIADEKRPRLGNDLRPAIIVSLGTGQDAGYAGTFASYQNRLDERKYQIVDNLTHSLGAHTLKVGGSGIFTNIKNQFILSGAGEYRFASLADFEANRPSSFVRNVREDGVVPFANFDVVEFGFYAQDEWRITPKLTATLGVRYDISRFAQAPGRVIEAEQAFGIQTGIAPSDDDNISPRFNAAYDVRGDGRSVVRGGVGYFYGRIPYVLGGNVQQTELPVLTVTCSGSIADGDPDAPPDISGYGSWSTSGANNPTNCAGGSGIGGVPTYTFWTEGFQYPETFKANLGYEQAIGAGTRVSIDAIYSRSTNLYTVRNINLRDYQFTLDSESGRRVFQPADVFSPTSTSTNHRRNLEFSDVFVNYNDGRARSFSLTVKGSHRFASRTTLGASYTYTSASDNSSYSCCTPTEGFTNPRVGIFGPNDLRKIGDTDGSWGPSNFVRNHTVIFEAITRLPLDFSVSAFWRFQTGNPWGPEQSGDLNGDGQRFNDRPFIFSPENLPLATTDATDAAMQRERYAGYLRDNPCVGDYVGQIIPRNTCRQASFNRLDVRVMKAFRTVGTQRLELQVDLFNVLNGLNSDWGVYRGVFAANRNILAPQGYDATTGEITYSVPSGFGTQGQVGTNLLLQFQMQLALRYFF